MSPKLSQFLQRWLITTLAVLVARYTVAGIHSDSNTSLLAASLLLGILNAIVRPIMLLLSLPLLIVTLGLFTLVINALLLWFVGQVIDSFHVDTFKAAFLGALIISVVSLVLNLLTGTGNASIKVRRGKKSPPKNGSGGPTIDV